jgi:hypothetical protein
MPVNIHGKEYITVAERVQAFHSETKDKVVSITTEFLPNGGLIVCQATVKIGDQVFQGTSAANPAKAIEKTSPYEVAETSAVGRALGFAGFGIIEGIASADEMIKALTEEKKPSVDRTNGFSTSQPANSNGKITTKQMGYIGKLIDQSNSDRARINEAYGVASIANLTSGQASQLIDQLNKKIETLSATQQA